MAFTLFWKTKKNSVHLKLAFETNSEPIVLFLFVPSTMFIRFMSLFLSSRLPPQERVVVLFISRESDYCKVGHWFADNHYLFWCLQNYLWDGNIFTRKCLSNFRCLWGISEIFSTYFYDLIQYMFFKTYKSITNGYFHNEQMAPRNKIYTENYLLWKSFIFIRNYLKDASLLIEYSSSSSS